VQITCGTSTKPAAAIKLHIKPGKVIVSKPRCKACVAKYEKLARNATRKLAPKQRQWIRKLQPQP
jgi:hypothetical protein